MVESDLAQHLIDYEKKLPAMSPEEKYLSMRNRAVLATAVGETRVGRGTRLRSQPEPKYIMPNAGLDLGGDALAVLQMARDSFKTSAECAQGLLGSTIKGSVLTADEIAALNQKESEVAVVIGEILGKHEIALAVNELVEFRKTGKTSNGIEFNQDILYYKTFDAVLGEKIRRTAPEALESENPQLKEVAAKYLRDRVTASLALGSIRVEMEDFEGLELQLNGCNQDNEGPHSTISDCIDLAERLAPNNPDLPELRLLTADLHRRFALAKDARKLDLPSLDKQKR